MFRRKRNPYPDTGESGEAYDAEFETLPRLKKSLEYVAFGCSIVAVASFIGIFTSITFYGVPIEIIEPNRYISFSELAFSFLGLIGLCVLFYRHWIKET